MKKLILKILAIGIQVCAPEFSYSQQDVNGWYWLNGRPQGNTVYWTQVINAENIVAVTHRGIFMKSTDGGDTWTLTQAGAPDLSSTGGLAKRDLFTGYFSNPTTGIVAGAAQTGTPSKTVVSKTTDGGTTWIIKEVNSTAGGSVNDICFINSTTGYLCGLTNARLYKTTDQGETWTNISNVPANPYYSMHAFDENNIILGSSSRRLVRTTDGGTTWITDTLFSAAANVQFLGMTFKDANTGYVTGSPKYFAYTTNAGDNWTASPHSSIFVQRSVAYDNGKVWTAGGYEWVYFSTNDGMNWDSVKFYDNSNDNQPSPFITYGIDGNGSRLIVVGSSGQITTSDDGGKSWVNKNYSVNNGGTNLYSSIYVESVSGRIWVGPTGGGNLLFSTNGGATWATQTTAHITSVFTIDFVDANTGYICGGRFPAVLGQLSATTNAGSNWNLLTLPTPINSNQLNSCDFVDFNTGWVTGGEGPFTPVILYKTTDAGITWAAQSLENSPTGFGLSVQMINASTGYLKTSNSINQLYHTTNGGTNWIRNTTSDVTSIPHSNMFVLSNDVIFLNGVGSGGLKKVIRSTDAGQTWTDLTSNLLSTVTIMKTKWLNLDHGVVCGTNGYTAKTTNGGASWVSSNPGFSTTVDLQFPDVNNWFTISDRNGAYQIGRNYDSSAGNPNQFSANIHQLYISYDTISPPIVSDWGELLLTYETTNYGRYLNLSIIAPDVDTIWQIENAYLPGYSNVFTDTLSFAFDIGDSGVVVNSVQYGISLTLDTLSTAPPVQFFSPISSKPMLITSGISDEEIAKIEKEYLKGKGYKGGTIDPTRAIQINPSYLTNVNCDINECVPAAIHNSLNYLKNLGSIDPPHPELLSVEKLGEATEFNPNHGVKLRDWIDGDYPIDNPKMGHPGKTNYLQRVDVPMRTRELKFSGNTTQNEEYMQIVFSELQAGQNIEVIVQKSNEIYGHAVMLTGIGKSLNEASTWYIKTNDDAIQGNDSEGTRKGWTKITSGTGKNHILLGTLSSGYVHVHSFVIECPSTNSAQATPVFPANDTNIILKNLIVKGDSLEGKIYTYTIEISKDSLFTWDSLILRRDTLSRPQTKFPTNIPKEELPRTYYWRIAANNASTGDGRFSPPRKINVFSSTKSLKGAVEGRSSNFLNSELSLNADTAYFLLRNPAPPYSIVDTLFTFIETDGTLREEPLEFYADYGSYYISFSHRNTLETWSSSPVLFSESDSTEFDFSISSSQAFGNNMTFVNGNWCFYSGDVNQDGTVDATDLSLIDNDAANFVSGYVVTDLTGDDFVDGTDFAIADNNAANFVSVIRP